MLDVERTHQIIRLHFVEGLSVRKIAQKLKIHRNTVKSRIEQYTRFKNCAEAEKEASTVQLVSYLEKGTTYDSSGRKARKLTAEISGRIDSCLADNDKKRLDGRRKQQLRKIDIHEVLVTAGFDVSYSSVCKYIAGKAMRSQEAFIKQDYGNVNISGKLLHDKLYQLLHFLSFNKEQIEKITAKVKISLKETVDIRKRQLVIKEEQYRSIDAKLTKAEEKFMDDSINKDTYKKWERKYLGERSRLEEEINYLKMDMDNTVDEELALLPQLLDMETLFTHATINQQHSILNEVFKQGLTFREQAFRTPSINPAFRHNTMEMKEKGLLFIEQPLDISSGLPLSGLKGTKIEPLVPLLTFIGDIDLDKSIDNEQVIKQNEIPHSYHTSAANTWQRKSTKRTPKKGLRRG